MLQNSGKNIGIKKNYMKNLIVIFTILTLIGCEPGYRIYVRNNASTILYLRTNPSIESLYPKWTGYNDSILAHKVSQEGKFSLYSIKPFDAFRIWDNIGGMPTSKEIPFDYVAVIRGVDTLILDNKEKIANQLKRGGKKFDYYIEIIK